MSTKEPIKTPLYDKLRPRYQLFLDKYTTRFQLKESAIHAGYSDRSGNASMKGKEIIERADVQAALKELMAVKRKQLEDSKTGVIERLKTQATVSLSDLCKWDPEAEQWCLKAPDEIDEQWLPVAGMVTVSREGRPVFNQGAQDNARKQLAQYMTWDKELRDDLPAVSFDFSGLKLSNYSKVKPPIGSG